VNIVLKNLKTVALDSNIFIYYFEENPEFGKAAKKIFDALSSNTLSATTSTVSLIELLAKNDLPENIARQLEEDFFSIPNLSVSEVNREIAATAARIRRKYGFRLPDAIQLACGKLNKAHAFISNDEGLKRFNELKVILIKDI